MKKMNFYFNPNRFGLLCIMMVALFVSRVSAQCPAVNFSYPAASCGGTVNVSTIYPGAVNVVKNGQLVTTLDRNDIGRTYQYNAVQANGATCWNLVTIEDKAAPVIVEPADITLNCTLAGSIKDLEVTGELSNDAAVIFNRAGTAGPFGSYTDCSKGEQFYQDSVVYDGGDCAVTTLTTVALPDGTVYNVLGGTIKIVVRKWWAKDFYKNQSAFGYQVIAVRRNIAAWSIRDTTVSCTTLDAALAARTTPGTTNAGTGVAGPFFVDGVNTLVPIGSRVCGVGAVWLGDDAPLTICTGTTKIVRRWRVTDLCSGGLMTRDTFQVITKRDDIKPVISTTWRNWLVKAGDNYAFDMNNGSITMCTTNNPTTKVVAMDSTKTLTATDTVITIRPLGMSSMCNAANIGSSGLDLFRVSATDLCGGSVTWMSTDSRISISATGRVFSTQPLMFDQSAATNDTTFTLMAVDPCGNTSTLVVKVYYVDNIAPNVDCDIDGLKATLDENGNARLLATQFDRGTEDNCGIKRVLVKRMSWNGTDCAQPWREYVDFSCADLGGTATACTDGTVAVNVRFVDIYDNVSECMVNVVIVDKKGPQCMDAAPISITCTSDSVTRINQLWVTPVAFDNCGFTTNSPEPTIPNFRCGSGSVTRNWTFTDCGGRTTACSQTITVTPVRRLEVVQLCDSTRFCDDLVGALSREALQARAKWFLSNNVRVIGCSSPQVEVEGWEFTGTDVCKTYRFRYSVIDACWDGAAGLQKNIRKFTCNGSNIVFGITADSAKIVYEQEIRIIDNTAPTVNAINDTTICSGITSCNFTFSKTLSGSDLCSSTAVSSALYYTWTITNDATGVVVRTVTGTTNTTVAPSANLAFGTYTVSYRAFDGCGNVSAPRTFKVTGSDCKAPEILVHNKIVALGGQSGNAASGMAVLNYDDIKNRIEDLCDGILTNESSKIRMELGAATGSPLLPTVAAGVRTVMFNCTHVGTQYVYVWARDEANNWNFARSIITVQDNDGICSVRAMIAGAAATENGSAVKDVVMTANTNGVAMGSSTSTAAGAFQVGNLPVGANYQVRAAKTIDTDKKNGVTTLDIALISKHNLGIEALATPYKVIAADVDKNGEVEGLDMLHIRRFILSITPSLPAGSAWRFVDKSYTFRNAANPFGEDFPEVINLSNVPAGTTAANFTAVKLGDVNNSFDATQVRGSRALTFNANDMDVVAGNEYTVAINAANFNAAAFQGTFAFEGATVKAVKAGNLNNTSDANFGMFSKAVTASWNGTSEASAEVVNITFVATKSGKLSNMLTVNSSVTMAEGYDAAGNAMNVTLKFNTGKVAGGEFALYQNTPNPVATSTSIGFNLPKDGQAKLTIYTAEGKVLSVINNTYKAGANQVTVNKSDLNASGMLYYRLDTQDNSSTRKMIIIE
jgi:hypothetical protein